MVNKFRANRTPSLLTRLAQMFFRLQTNEKTTLCYSVHSRLGSNMATHTPVGVDVPDDPRIRTNSVRPLLYLYFFNGRENPSPTDANCFDSKMAALCSSKS